MININERQGLSRNALIYQWCAMVIPVAFFGCIGVLYIVATKANAVFISMLAVIYAIVVLVGFVYTYWYWKLFAYTIAQDSVTVRAGVLFQSEKTVNFNKLQDVQIQSGPLLLAFGLSRVQGFTSSPGQISIQTHSSGNGSQTTTVYTPDVDLLLDKDLAEEFRQLAQKGDIQKVQEVPAVATASQ